MLPTKVVAMIVSEGNRATVQTQKSTNNYSTYQKTRKIQHFFIKEKRKHQCQNQLRQWVEKTSRLRNGLNSKTIK